MLSFSVMHYSRSAPVGVANAAAVTSFKDVMKYEESKLSAAAKNNHTTAPAANNRSGSARLKPNHR